MDRSKLKQNLKAVFPTVSIVFIGIFIFGLLVLLLSKLSVPFADFWNRYVASVFRGALAWATNLLPFSLAEYALLCSPVILAIVIRYVCKNKIASSWKKTIRFSVTALATASLAISSLNICFSAGYNTSTLDKKLGMERQKVTAEELYLTAEILVSELNGLTDQIVYSSSGESYMQYSFSEMTEKLNAAYNGVCDEYSFIPRLYSRPKQVVLSEPWTYTHISGVYTYFTGEANININFPDYTLPFTAAHEMAHQRGIAREDEANFVAFLVCKESFDPYIRYSAYLNLYEYVANALYKADKELYRDVYSSLDKRIVGEEKAYSAFFDKYRDNVVADVSGAVNDSYLQSQGQTAGSKSYGLVVDLAVSYYLHGGE